MKEYEKGLCSKETISLEKKIVIETNRVKHEVSNLVVVYNNGLKQAKLIDLEERTCFTIRLWTSEEWYAHVENEMRG